MAADAPARRLEWSPGALDAYLSTVARIAAEDPVTTRRFVQATLSHPLYDPPRQASAEMVRRTLGRSAMIWELAALALVLAAAWLWRDSLRAREHAVAAGRAACARYGVQLLDETVAFARLRLARGDEGRLRLRRTYVFEFSETGDNRRHGAIVMLGARLEDLQLEPYRLQ